MKLKEADIVSMLCGSYVGSSKYADDLLLLSSSFTGLQQLLNICYSNCKDSMLEFNSNKSSCAVIGRSARYDIGSMTLGTNKLN